MLTSSPRRLATIAFFTLVSLLYLFTTSSQRFDTAQTIRDTHSHKHKHVSDSNPGPDVAIELAHHHHSILPTKAPVPPSKAGHSESKGINPSTESSAKVSKIHQVTMIFDGNGLEHEMYERALKTHLEHGERWGYETHVLREDIVGAGKSGRDLKGNWQYGVFRKPLYLLSLVINELAKPKEKRAEWIVWIDGDTIILNPNIPFEAFLPPPGPLFDSVHFLGSQDWWGFNCSVFFMRVHEWNVHLLTDVAAVPRLCPDLELYGQPDQNAMKYMFREEQRKDNVVYQPKHWYNAYYNGPANKTEIREGEGELLVHFAGFYSNRSEAMAEWFDKLEKEPEKHAIPIEQTHVREDVGEFWSQLRKGKVLLQDMAIAQEKQNTSTKAKSYEKLKNAVQSYAEDNKRLGEAMREAQTAMGQENQPKKKGDAEGA